MSQQATALSEDAASKGSTSNSGIKNTSTAYKSKIPMTQFSRTGTQGNGASRNGAEDPSGSGGSEVSSARRPTSSKNSAAATATSTKKPLAASSSQKRQLENQYSMKKKRYASLRKELGEKQRNASELYDELVEMREKLIACGAKDPGKPEASKLPEVGFPAHTAAALDPSEAKQPLLVEKVSLPNDFVARMETQLSEVPRKCQEFCEETLEKHTNVTTWLMDFVRTQRNEEEENILDPTIAVIFESYRRDNENLRKQFLEMRNAQNELVSGLIKNSCDLYRECEESRRRLQEIEERMEQQKDVRTQLAEALSELQAERERNSQSRERRSQLESQLQKSRARTRELECQVANGEAKIQQLQTSLKSLESQLKQKDAVMEQRLKDMQRTMKNSENLVAKMEKQRDTFESRLVELREKMSSKESEAMQTLKQMTEKMDAVAAELEEEREKRQHAEAMVAESEKRCKQLEEKGRQLYQLAESSKRFGVTDDNHSDNEVRLFNELQFTRAEVADLKEKMKQLELEKVEIVTLMDLCEDDDDESKNRLAAELINKSEELQTVISQNKLLQKNTKILQEKSDSLEKRLEEIQDRLQNKESGKITSSFHAFELQQQISDLRSSLADALRQNEEYETALTQKQLQIEQRDRVLREQSEYIKTREDLFNLINRKGEEAGEGSREDGNYEEAEEAKKQITVKAEAIQELYAMLESKQIQVLRLEKMVKQMEDQQDRAQAQRTRLENKIAQLELTLQEKTKNRSRGFSIL